VAVSWSVGLAIKIFTSFSGMVEGSSSNYLKNKKAINFHISLSSERPHFSGSQSVSETYLSSWWTDDVYLEPNTAALINWSLSVRYHMHRSLDWSFRLTSSNTHEFDKTEIIIKYLRLINRKQKWYNLNSTDGTNIKKNCKNIKINSIPLSILLISI
jgi:hypothetical protein